MCHCQNNNKEDLFRMLRRSDGKEFEEDVIRNWYRARNYVLNTLESKDVFYKMIHDHRKVNVVLESASQLMLAVARQIALLVHYPTFNEATGSNRTTITILFDKHKVPLSYIWDYVSKEEHLCNLPRYCKCTVRDFESKADTFSNKNSFLKFLDIELELIGFDGSDFSEYKSPDSLPDPLRIKEEEVSNHDFDETIDISMAKRVNMVYNVGADIDNLPQDDPNTASQYDRAMLWFCYQQTPEIAQEKWDEIENNRIGVKKKLSNVFCADCFTSRLLYAFNTYKKKEDPEISGKNMGEYLKSKYRKVANIVKENLKSLAQCEHSRWNVEKLVLGFRPLSEEELLEDEQRFENDRTAYRKSLKKENVHIDLCSYRDMKRLNPDDMKYDSFLVIAAPKILLEKETDNSAKTL